MGGMKTCLDWAIDGFNVTGTPLVYYFNNNLAVTYSATPANVKPTLA
jgi:GH43 family beta-xylosidase